MMPALATHRPWAVKVLIVGEDRAATYPFRKMLRATSFPIEQHAAWTSKMVEHSVYELACDVMLVVQGTNVHETSWVEIAQHGSIPVMLATHTRQVNLPNGILGLRVDRRSATAELIENGLLSLWRKRHTVVTHMRAPGRSAAIHRSAVLLH